jgi:hypothetical protein
MLKAHCATVKFVPKISDICHIEKQGVPVKPLAAKKAGDAMAPPVLKARPTHCINGLGPARLVLAQIVAAVLTEKQFGLG